MCLAMLCTTVNLYQHQKILKTWTLQMSSVYLHILTTASSCGSGESKPVFIVFRILLDFDLGLCL